MNRVFFIAIVMTLFSCGRSKEEQMLYDYQSKVVKESFNTDLEELNFKINSINKIGEIKASDSSKILKDKLVKIWFNNQQFSQKEADTLSFDFVINELDKLTKLYQEIILSNIRLDEEYRNYEYQKKRDATVRSSTEVFLWKEEFEKYSKKPNEVLSVKYKANYSIQNPVLKIKQTFEKIYYTDGSLIKIKAEEKSE